MLPGGGLRAERQGGLASVTDDEVNEPFTDVGLGDDAVVRRIVVIHVSNRMCPAARHGGRSTPMGLFLTRSACARVPDLRYHDSSRIAFNLGVDLSSHAGFEASLSHHFDNSYTLEARYAGVDRWSAQSTTPTTPGDILQINAAVPDVHGGGDGD